MIPGLLWGIVCSSSLPASGVLQYRVSLLSGDDCDFEQVITLLEQNQHLLSPAAANRNELTVWSGERLKLAGSGVAWQAHFSGENSFTAAEEAWRDLCEHAQDTTGSGEEMSPVAARLRQGEAGKNCCLEAEKINWPLVLGSFGFTSSTPSLLLVPALAVVSSGGNTWLWQARWQAGQEIVRGSWGNTPKNTESATVSIPKDSPLPSSGSARVLREAYPHLHPEAWMAAVSHASKEIRAGQAEKIVLARDKELRFDRDISLVRVTTYLAKKYPGCWSYAIGDLVGVSPEMLASVSEGKLLCRVLAGSAIPSQEQRLLSAPKEQLEHRLAVQSAQESLTDLNLDLEIPAPRLLHLGYVTHLATDITAENLAHHAVTSLRAAAALHPTAAVCGKPREVAAARLAALEAMDRRRYAAPIGWMDATGDGEWAIALRCAQRVPARADTYRLIAGAGIMGDSDPQRELAETETKMSPMLCALQA